jgi:uncharacterized protein YbjT (DUF2867 family)
VSERLFLVTGASGYVGGRLVRALRERGERIRCLARRPEYLAPRLASGVAVVRTRLVPLQPGQRCRGATFVASCTSVAGIQCILQVSLF